MQVFTVFKQALLLDGGSILTKYLRRLYVLTLDLKKVVIPSTQGLIFWDLPFGVRTESKSYAAFDPALLEYAWQGGPVSWLLIATLWTHKGERSEGFQSVAWLVFHDAVAQLQSLQGYFLVPPPLGFPLLVLAGKRAG